MRFLTKYPQKKNKKTLTLSSFFLFINALNPSLQNPSVSRYSKDGKTIFYMNQHHKLQLTSTKLSPLSFIIFNLFIFTLYYPN